MAASAVPVQESVGAALRFVRENWRFVTIVAAVFAVLSTLVSGLALFVPQVGLLAMAASGVIQAFCYAALIAAALFGAQGVGARWPRDGWRVWASMAVIGFFLFIVMFVVTIPISIALAAGPLAPYVGDLQQAGSDQAAVMAVMTRFMQENATAMLLVSLFYGAVWFLLTSRLYLAAPASVDAGRILTFETWKWTKGAMLRITWARVMLLLPSYVLMFTLTLLLGRLFGFDVLDGASLQAAVRANLIGVIVFEFVSSFIVMALYASLEAGLSSYLYRGLRPEEAPPAA
jgi:hypothetical protein